MDSTKKNARVAGLLYLLLGTGVVNLIYVPRTLIVRGNATATANNILAHESLFRLGIVSGLVSAVIFIFVVLALYRLLKGVDQNHAVLMVVLALVSVPIGFVSTPSPCCSSVCIATETPSTRSSGGCGCFPSGCSSSGRASFPASWASG